MERYKKINLNLFIYHKNILLFLIPKTEYPKMMVIQLIQI